MVLPELLLDPLQEPCTLTPVLKDLRLLEGHQAALYHLIEHGKEGVDLVLGIDDLDDHGEVLRQRQQVSFVQLGRLAKAERSAQHRGSSQVHLTSLVDDRDVERLKAVTICDAYEDAQQHGIMRYIH